MSATEPVALAGRTIDSPVTVLLVDDDPDDVELLSIELERDPRLTVETATTVDAALKRLDGIDCVVSDHSMPTTGLEFLERVRERDPALPFVLHTGESREAVLGDLLAHERTDYQRKGSAPGSFDLLARRVRRLVDRRRAVDELRRTRVGLDAVQDGVAIADPNGVVAFANRPYAAAFGVDRNTVIGEHWRTRHPEAEADRLVADAVPTARDGWRWTGTCAGFDGAGEPVELRLSLVGLEDRSLVFVVERADDARGASERAN